MWVPNLVFLVLLVTPTAPSGKVVILNQSPVVPLYHHPPDISICRHSSVHPRPVDYHWGEPALWRRWWTPSGGEHMAWESTGRRQSGNGGPELAEHSATTWLRRKRWAGRGACMSSQSLPISDLTETFSPSLLDPSQGQESSVWKIVLVVAVLLVSVVGLLSAAYYMCMWRGGRIHYKLHTQGYA